jgi:hypothetical protein
VRVVNADGTTTTTDPKTGTTATMARMKTEVAVRLQESMAGRRRFDLVIQDARERLLDVQDQVTRELYPTDIARPYRFDSYADPMLMYGEPATCTKEWLARVGPRFDITRRAQQELTALAALAPTDEQRVAYPHASADWCVLVTHWLNILWFALGINPRFLLPQVGVYSRMTLSDPSAIRYSTDPADLQRAQWMGGQLVRGTASGFPPCYDAAAAAAAPDDPEAGFAGCVGQRQPMRTFEQYHRVFGTAAAQDAAFIAQVRRTAPTFSAARQATSPTLGAQWYTPRSSFVGNTPTVVSSYSLALAIDAAPANRGEPGYVGAALADLTLTNPGGLMLHGWFGAGSAGNWRLLKGRKVTDKWVLPQSVFQRFGAVRGVQSAGLDAWRWWFEAERHESRLILPARAFEGGAGWGASPRQEVARLKAIAQDTSRLNLVELARDSFLFWAENHIRWFESMGEVTTTWAELRAQYDRARAEARQSMVEMSQAFASSANALLELIGTVAGLIIQIAGIVVAPLLKWAAKKGTGPGMIPVTSSGPAYPQPFLIRSLEHVECNLSGESQGANEMLRRNETLYFPGVRPGAGGEGATAVDWLRNPWVLAGVGAAAGVGAMALTRGKR